MEKCEKILNHEAKYVIEYSHSNKPETVVTVFIVKIWSRFSCF